METVNLIIMGTIFAASAFNLYLKIKEAQSLQNEKRRLYALVEDARAKSRMYRALGLKNRQFKFDEKTDRFMKQLEYY